MPVGQSHARQRTNQFVWLPGGFNGVNVKDVARGHWLACLKGRPGERYIFGGHNMTYKDFGMI
jgi:hypothetical protein